MVILTCIRLFPVPDSCSERGLTIVSLDEDTLLGLNGRRTVLNTVNSRKFSIRTFLCLGLSPGFSCIYSVLIKRYRGIILAIGLVYFSSSYTTSVFRAT